MAQIAISIRSTIAYARTCAFVPGLISLKLPDHEGDVTFLIGDDALSCKLADAINKVLQEHAAARAADDARKAA